MARKMSIEEHFSLKVNKGEGDGCWLWIGNLMVDGYARIKINGRATVVHRVSWERENGPIPAGLLVCHKCDVRNCVRVDHLFLGTTQDNLKDRDNKGRQAKGDRQGLRVHPESAPRGDRNGSRTRPECLARGEDNASAVLTERSVVEIRRLYALGNVKQIDLAKQFGIKQPQISSVIRRATWKHVK